MTGQGRNRKYDWERIWRYCTLLYFIIYFIAGLCVYKDYGFTVDEEKQRERSLVSYKYMNEVLLGRDMPGLEDIPEMDEKNHGYYGTAMQMPMAFMEDIHGFTMTTREIYLMRHLYNFIVCFVGYVCFYFALRKIFPEDRFYAFAGTLIVSLYPRFFGYQFTDIKNLIFAALNMVVLLTLVYVVEKENWLTIVLFGITAALATNQRVMAIIYPVFLLGYWLLRDLTILIKDRKIAENKALFFIKYPLVIISYFLFWVIISPFAWIHPVISFKKTFKAFSHFQGWNGYMAFMGKLITSTELPWYYLFVWMGITIPVLYMFLFFMGHVGLIFSLKKEGKGWWENGVLGKGKWFACCIGMFWGIVCAIIMLHCKIYESWYHVFFAFVPFTVVAVYGFKFCAEIINKKIVGIVFGICIVLIAGWNIRNHPYQQVYFNMIGRQYAHLFERDSQYADSSELMRWILDHTEGEVKVSGYTLSTLLLSEEEKLRIVKDYEAGDYHIDIFLNVIGNEAVHEGYEEVYAVWVDGYKIGAVYQKINK